MFLFAMQTEIDHGWLTQATSHAMIFVSPPCMLAQIRSLINACLAKIYATAETLPMFSRINELQAYLSSKDGNGKPFTDVSPAG